MANFLHRKKIKPFQPIYTGKNTDVKTKIFLITYDIDFYEEREITNLNEINFQDFSKKFWLQVRGFNDLEFLISFCNKLKIDLLAIQDIFDANQRTKIQKFDDFTFFTLQSIEKTLDGNFFTDHVSFVLGDNFLVSFQESENKHFLHLEKRFKEDLGMVRKKDLEYLLFLMLESIFDNFFHTLNNIEKELHSLDLISKKEMFISPEKLYDLEYYKNRVYAVKSHIIPFKEFFLRFDRNGFTFLKDKNSKYFFELQDLIFTILDFCDQIYMKIESNLNLFFSMQSYKINKIMNTLTIVSTIFIPLTFIVGVYGMNFKYMPELEWYWGYFVVMTIMIIVAVILLLFFKRKKWF